ncbi:MAG TPA: FkbM family methyltransferase [Steroidobacteraceae bacterium]|nr:FkbM family methyltransferase [Steroidobacteraceae bacterium]
MLRTLAEKLSRGIAFRRRLPSSVGGLAVYVSPDSQLKYLKPHDAAFDPSVLRLAMEHVHDRSVVWDVGANVGVFTFAAAGLARAGEVVAIEPDAWLAHLLRRSSRLPRNARAAVSVVSLAVSDRNGVADFVVASRGRASNYLTATGGRTQSGGARERLHVPTLTLDTLLETFRPPTFLKIDVEGAEALALRGAYRMLHEVRPALYIEVGEPNAAEVSALLAAANYRIYDSTRPGDARAQLDRCVQDTLALPYP